MAALDFPSSPTNGQVYGQYTYDSTKGAWRVTAANGATAVASPTTPASPVAGNLWYNTNDGIMFMYYADGDSSQWVEVKANSSLGSTVPARVDALELADATTNKSGLVPVIPTSVAVNGGSATVAANGEVTFTGTSGLVVNNIFTSTYKHYVVWVSGFKAAVMSGISFRFTDSAGTPNSGSAYYYGGAIYSGANGSVLNGVASSSGFLHDATDPATYNAMKLEIRNPEVANITNYQIQFSGWGTQNRNGSIGGFYDSSTARFQGLQIFANNSTQITGTIQVYGYR